MVNLHYLICFMYTHLCSASVVRSFFPVNGVHIT